MIEENIPDTSVSGMFFCIATKYCKIYLDTIYIAI